MTQWNHVIPMLGMLAFVYLVVVDTEVNGMKTPVRRARWRGVIAVAAAAGVAMALVS